jgi:hypothetical protein
MKNISEFVKGDKITRVEPAKPYSSSGVSDRSYMGQELTFVGIANGQIYLKSDDKTYFLSDRLINVAVDLWSDGWDNYIDPLSLIDGNEDFVKGTSYSIETQIEKALKEEDYVLADKLKKDLETLNQKQ